MTDRQRDGGHQTQDYRVRAHTITMEPGSVDTTVPVVSTAFGGRVDNRLSVPKVHSLSVFR